MILSPTYQILFMQRPTKGTFPSMHVFPGGVVEQSDSSPQYAALRETYEETGLLITPDLKNNPRVIKDRRLPYSEAMVKYMPNAQSSSIQLPHISSWTTPVAGKGDGIGSKRFETDFYLYKCPLAPYDIGPLTSNSESTKLEWLSPTEALDKFSQGSIKLMPPQFYILNSLAKHGLNKTVNQLHDREFKPFIEKKFPDKSQLLFNWGLGEYGLVTLTEGVISKIEHRTSASLL